MAEHERRLRTMFGGFAPLMRDTATGEEAVVRFSLGFFGQMASGGAWLMAGLADSETRTDDDRLAAAALARAQLPDGRWRVGLPRVPLQESDIQSTALAARTIAAFSADGGETSARLARARTWLLSTVPSTSAERAYRLIGLRATGAGDRDIRDAAAALAASQQQNGGQSRLSG